MSVWVFWSLKYHISSSTKKPPIFYNTKDVEETFSLSYWLFFLSFLLWFKFITLFWFSEFFFFSILIFFTSRLFCRFFSNSRNFLSFFCLRHLFDFHLAFLFLLLLFISLIFFFFALASLFLRDLPLDCFLFVFF